MALNSEEAEGEEAQVRSLQDPTQQKFADPQGLVVLGCVGVGWQ